MTKFGKSLIASVKEGIASVKADLKGSEVVFPVDIDVKAIRRATRLSQEDFSALYGFTIAQIRDWEQGRSNPVGAARAYLMIIQSNPEAVRKMLKKASLKAA